MIDVCPTGAISEKLPFIKPGPWKTKPVKTVCNGCNFACEMNIEVYEDMLVRASSVAGWNNGHLCDICRFKRPWAEDLTFPLLNGEKVEWEKVREFIGNHKDIALILTPELTNEEIKYFKKVAEERGFKLGAFVEEGISTATPEDIKKAKKVLLRADIEKYPYLKVLLKGKEFVEEDYEVAVLEAPAEPLEVPTLILHEGVNEVGLLKLGVKGLPEAEAYVVIGKPRKELKGDVLALPSGLWAEKEGTIINAFNMELKVSKAREPEYSAKDIFSL